MKSYIKILILLLAVAGCKKPYNPVLSSSAASYLVVEGLINSGADSTVIKLSKTVNIGTKIPVPEINAIVTVEGDQNSSYLLKEIAKGTYVFAGLNLDHTHKYRLRIKTTDNKEYLSDYQEVVITPPIDSIGFTAQSDGIRLYLNTHDTKNSTRYYRWDYTEAWQFHSKYVSSYKVGKDNKGNNAIFTKLPNEVTYYCFANSSSNSILLGSSAKLAEDVIYQAPITFVPSNSEKLELKYSIQVRQFALTKEAFNFWTNLKNISEQLGGIFDAQPSQISGNIHNVNNAAEPVIGYISVSTVQLKRVFIRYEELPQGYFAVYPYECTADTALLHNPKTQQNDVQLLILDNPGFYIPLTEVDVNGKLIGYTASSPECSDCTIRGVVKAPLFWK
ncbi:hypothetical protein BH09BAC6_BH09BAC6_05590 [soil metagenome]